MTRPKKGTTRRSSRSLIPFAFGCSLTLLISLHLFNPRFLKSVVGAEAAKPTAPHPSGDTRTVYSPDQARQLAQAWIDARTPQILEWRHASAGPGKRYYNLDGLPVVYLFSILRQGHDVGYVVISYQVDLQPIIEFSTNPAPHLRCGGACQDALQSEGWVVDRSRPLYLGPLDYFFPVGRPFPSWEGRRWVVTMDGDRIIEVPDVPPRPIPIDQWGEVTVKPAGWLADAESVQKIYGLPDFNQFFGPDYAYRFSCYSGCTPTAAATLAHFWSEAGYPALGDPDWRDTVAELWGHLGTFCLANEGTTWTHTVASGLVSFAIGRGYSFDSTQYCWPTTLNWIGCQSREFTWERYTDEIDQCRPPLISIVNHPLYGSHTVTGVGYDTTAGNFYIVHDNWSSTPQDVWILHQDEEKRYRFLYPFVPPQLDHTPPVSATIAPLPDYQPDTRFDVSWRGTDLFPGVGSYDLQYRDGLYGDWQWWLRGTPDTSGRLSDHVQLTGGHTYYVRVRARDKHCNVGPWSAALGSKVDADPPFTAVRPLPRYRSARSFKVFWDGWDDASGVATYEVFVRSDSADWATWQEATAATTAVFTGTQVGATYDFLSLGTDRLARRESKTTDQSDTRVTIARHAVSGRVIGNQGEPYLQTRVSASGAYTSTETGPRGDFRLFFPFDGTTDLTVTSSAGQAVLPPLKGISLTSGITTVTGVELVLPPTDNRLQNSHFEEPLTGEDWELAGVTTPTRTFQAHTGDYALVLGLLPPITNPAQERGRSAPIPLSGGHDYRAHGAGLRWTVSQTTYLSPSLTKPTLSWLYDTVGTPHISDTLNIAIASPLGSRVYAASLGPSGWRHTWLELEGLLAGQTVTVTFDLWRPHGTLLSEPCLVLLDEITLGSGHTESSLLFLPILQK